MTISLTPPSSPAAAPQSPDPAAHEAALRQVAQDLEASFLAEMLKHSGFGAAREAFGGGQGEDQFASLLRAEHARAIAARGGIGLAESIFQSLLERAGPGPAADRDGSA